MRVASHGRFGHDFDLHHGSCALAVSRADAVGACVAAADDEDMFPVGSDSFFVFELFSRQHFVLLREIVECEVNAGEFASRDVKVARRRCACAETPGVKAFGEFFRVDGGGGDEADASASMTRRRRSITVFWSLKFGMP